MKRSHVFPIVAVCVFTGLTASACGSASDDPEGGLVGEALQPLGEIECASDYEDAQNSSCSYAPLTGCYTWSADATYDHPLCRHQWVVGYPTPPTDHHITMGVAWNGSALTSSNCANAHMTLGTYFFDANGDTIHFWDETKLHGAWSTSSNHCFFQYDSGFAPITQRLLTSTQNYVTGAASAFFRDPITGITSYQKVGVDLFVESN
jgi:hypothetical protein